MTIPDVVARYAKQIEQEEEHMETVLSILFPVTLPALSEETLPDTSSFSHDPFATPVTECGVVSVRRKPFRDAIERIESEWSAT